MKQLAILNYLFLFDPSETQWTSGSKFEASLVDYFAAYGFQADIVQTAGSGVKAVSIQKIDPLNQVQQQPIVRQTKPSNILKPQSEITNNFKKFSYPNSSNSPQPQKLGYAPGGRQNATSVKKPLSVKFKGGK